MARDGATGDRGLGARTAFRAFLDTVFETYGRMYGPMEAFYQERFPRMMADSDFVYRSTIMAKTCDTLRMLLPAATRSNLGIYATGTILRTAVDALGARIRSRRCATTAS